MDLIVITAPDLDSEAQEEIDEVHHWSTEVAAQHFARLADARERQCRRLVEQKLRPRLRWLVNHPRLLALVYRAVPSWRPTLKLTATNAYGVSDSGPARLP